MSTDSNVAVILISAYYCLMKLYIFIIVNFYWVFQDALNNTHLYMNYEMYPCLNNNLSNIFININKTKGLHHSYGFPY